MLPAVGRDRHPVALSKERAQVAFACKAAGCHEVGVAHVRFGKQAFELRETGGEDLVLDRVTELFPKDILKVSARESRPCDDSAYVK